MKKLVLFLITMMISISSFGQYHKVWISGDIGFTGTGTVIERNPNKDKDQITMVSAIQFGGFVTSNLSLGLNVGFQHDFSTTINGFYVVPQVGVPIRISDHCLYHPNLMLGYLRSSVFYDDMSQRMGVNYGVIVFNPITFEWSVGRRIAFDMSLLSVEYAFTGEIYDGNFFIFKVLSPTVGFKVYLGQ